MDLNFHYFAIKTLAVKAGFEDKDGKGAAQTLATYSQFVDDYDWFAPFFVYDVPDYARYLATKIAGSLYFFYPVTTGFSFFDYPKLMIETYQRNILIPFHFITKDPLTVIQADRKRYRVEPVKNGGVTMMNQLLDDAGSRYRQTQSRENLLRVGTLLHTYADTYAHQRFSGYWGWENNTYLEDVVDNVTMNNVTASYYPDVYWHMPSVGHPNVNTAPDDSNASFAFQQKYDEPEEYPYKAHYSRSNPDEFLVAARQIIDYMRLCLNKSPYGDDAWNLLAPDLKKGFLTAEKDVNKLITHWTNIFPGISFHYNKKDVLAPVTGQARSKPEGVVLPESMGTTAYNLFDKMSDDFYRYNVIADVIRKTVNPSVSVPR